MLCNKLTHYPKIYSAISRTFNLFHESYMKTLFPLECNAFQQLYQNNKTL